MEKDVAVIVDENRRGVVLEKVMKHMEATREPVVVQVSIPPELPEAAMGESELKYLEGVQNSVSVNLKLI